MSFKPNFFATDSPGNDEQDAQQGSCDPNVLK